MADFCKQCSIENFGEDLGDLEGLCRPGEIVYVICEGCSGSIVDHTGKCVDPVCEEHKDE